MMDTKTNSSFDSNAPQYLTLMLQEPWLNNHKQPPNNDSTNTPRLVTLLRRIGLGFTPQPLDKLAKVEDDEMEDGEREDMDVGLVGGLLLDLDI